MQEKEDVQEKLRRSGDTGGKLQYNYSTRNHKYLHASNIGTENIFLSDCSQRLAFRLGPPVLMLPMMQNCAIYIAMLQYRPISVILSDIVTILI